MKNLYSDTDHYSNETNALDRETINALRPVFEAWAAKGYSVRQIAHVMQGSITDLELETMLDRRSHQG